MHDWSIPLILAIAAFLALVLWRVRPAPSTWGRRRRGRRQAIREAQARIEAATDGAARALALCDAADLLVKTVAGAASASGLYLRAMRSDPRSVDVIQRAGSGLAGRPRTLESLLWRHLAVAGPWGGASRTAACASIERLRELYEGPLRNSVRARALANALETLSVER